MQKQVTFFLRYFRPKVVYFERYMKVHTAYLVSDL